MPEYLHEAPLVFYLWVLTLTLTVSSALLLTRFSLRIRKTIIGRTILHISISFIFWAAATASMALHHAEAIEVYGAVYMSLASMASLFTTYATWQGMVIQGILVPGQIGRTEPKHASAILGSAVFTIGFVGFIRFALNNPFLNAMMDGMSVLTAVGLMLLSVPLITGYRVKFSDKIVLAVAVLTLVIATISLAGHVLAIPILYAPLPGGDVSISTALGFIAAGIYVLLAKREAMKIKVIRLNIAVFILLLAVIALLGLLLDLPALHSQSPFARLPVPTALGFILVGSAFSWRVWKTL